MREKKKERLTRLGRRRAKESAARGLRHLVREAPAPFPSPVDETERVWSDEFERLRARLLRWLDHRVAVLEQRPTDDQPVLW